MIGSLLCFVMRFICSGFYSVSSLAQHTSLHVVSCEVLFAFIYLLPLNDIVLPSLCWRARNRYVKKDTPYLYAISIYNNINQKIPFFLISLFVVRSRQQNYLLFLSSYHINMPCFQHSCISRYTSSTVEYRNPQNEAATVQQLYEVLYSKPHIVVVFFFIKSGTKRNDTIRYDAMR